MTALRTESRAEWMRLPMVAGGGKDREARLTRGSEAQSNNPALAFLVHRASEPPGLSCMTDLPGQLAN
jgi:hypothetical protein